MILLCSLPPEVVGEVLESSSQRFAKGDSVLSLPSSYFKAWQGGVGSRCGDREALAHRQAHVATQQEWYEEEVHGAPWLSLISAVLCFSALKWLASCFLCCRGVLSSAESHAQVLLTNFPVRGGFSVPGLMFGSFLNLKSCAWVGQHMRPLPCPKCFCVPACLHGYNDDNGAGLVCNQAHIRSFKQACGQFVKPNHHNAFAACHADSR